MYLKKCFYRFTVRFVFASKIEEDLFEGSLGDGVVLDPGDLLFYLLHDAEKQMPGCGGVRNVEVNVVKMLVCHDTFVES